MDKIFAEEQMFCHEQAYPGGLEVFKLLCRRLCGLALFECNDVKKDRRYFRSSRASQSEMVLGLAKWRKKNTQVGIARTRASAFDCKQYLSYPFVLSWPCGLLLGLHILTKHVGFSPSHQQSYSCHHARPFRKRHLTERVVFPEANID